MCGVLSHSHVLCVSFVAQLAPKMLRALAGKEDWKRVHGRMACKAAGAHVPPPTEWHEPECGSYYPHLSTHPFHEPRDPWYSERVATAVELLERFYPLIKEEMLALPPNRRCMRSSSALASASI